jgi:hypothetical protein
MSEQQPVEPTPADAPVADAAQDAAAAPDAGPTPSEAPLEATAPDAAASHPPAGRSASAVVIGALFVLLGVFFLLDEIWDDFLGWQYVWPVMLIVIGAAVLLKARR